MAKYRTLVGINYPGEDGKEVRVEANKTVDLPPPVAKALKDALMPEAEAKKAEVERKAERTGEGGEV